MGATIRNAAIKNTTTRAFVTINGTKYGHYSYCKHRHDVFITINGATYYKLDDTKK